MGGNSGQVANFVMKVAVKVASIMGKSYENVASLSVINLHQTIHNFRQGNF